MTRTGKWVFGLLGSLLVSIYLGAYALGDLREHTIAFEGLFFGAFVLYAVACFLILGSTVLDRRLLYGLFAAAAFMQAVLVFTRPTLSDDMYRYVWDGRVQAQGISPYRYAPQAAELSYLRDEQVYPHINRKTAVTVYPPAAEALYGLLWRIWPDNVHWFQAVSAGGGLLAGALLGGLLRDLKRAPARVLIYLWSPLLAFETAHAAHVDGLVLPLVVGAWWARARERDGLTGFLLGVATAIKFYPALLLPFLWRPRHPQGWWRMPVAFGGALGMFYLPYLLTGDPQVLGYLPHYFQETFNIGPLVTVLNKVLNALHWHAPYRLIVLALGGLLVVAGWCLAHPAENGETALRRCIWPIGVVTLLSQNLFSWYMLWLLPLIAIFLEPSGKSLGWLKLPRADAWTGWWAFCGLVALSYTFFIRWKPVRAAIQVQYLPLYAFLILALWRSRGKLTTVP